MAEDTENLTLHTLRRMEARLGQIDARLERLETEFHDVKVRLTGVE